MEVKMEVVDPPIDSTAVSIMKMYKEMSEKYGKLQQEFVELKKENSEIKREMAKLKNEMVMKKAKFQEQIIKMNEELAKFRDQNRREDLEKQQSQKSMMDNSHTIERAQNKSIEAMIDEFNQRAKQNLANDSTENANTIIKRELKNAEIGEYFQIPTTSSTLNNEEGEDEGDERIGLEEFVVEVEGLEKIEWDDEESGSPSAMMDLDGEDENGKRKSENMEICNIDNGQIKCAPIKIGKILKCNWLGYEYQTKKDNDRMSSHWRTHTGERPFVCVECGQSFVQSAHLTVHKRIHTGEKPYRCDVCGQSFTNSNLLKNHALIHSGEKPYQCGVCGKSFRQSGGLTEHKRIHTDEKPYVCAECGKSFRHSKTLKKHELIHKGEKPHRCDVCGQSFRQSGHLVVHKRIHTGNKPHRCDVCGKSFRQNGTLSEHKRRIHHIDERPN